MIQLQGFDEFIKQVEKLGDSQKKTVVAGIMRKNLQPVAAAIKVLAPVRNSKHTKIKYRKNGEISTQTEAGNLKRSIGVKSFTGRNTVSAYAGIQKKKNADGWYGSFLIRGTKKIKVKNPFIERAAAYTLPKANRQLGNDINDYIIKNGKKLGLDIK